MNSALLTAIADHLWQSTLFGLAAACLTLFLRHNSARIRWSVWLAASVKFLLPFAWLSALGAQFPWPAAPVHLPPGLLHSAGQTVVGVARISAEPVVALGQMPHGAAYAGVLFISLEVLWALGAFFVAARWLNRWLALRRVLQQSTSSTLTFDIPVRSTATQLEPAVVGVLRPVLLLPKGLEQHLATEELQAVLAHERCHVVWRDNLTATVHMVVETLFWFHPLVWWLGKRMVEERERACDERVLAQGHGAGRYAEGILKVCEHYLQSPLSSAAGVGGGLLSRRIEVIMKNRLIERLGVLRKMLLTAAACATLAVPLAIGSLSAPDGVAAAATTEASAPVLNNVVIELAPPPSLNEQPPRGIGIGFVLAGPSGDGRVQVIYSSMRDFVAGAYGVDPSQIVGKDLSKEPLYQITADSPFAREKPTDSGEVRTARYLALSQGMPDLQRSLLAKQFGLVVKRERRQLEGYVLTVGPGGSKLQPDSTASFIEQGTGQSDREYIATMTPVANIVGLLERMFRAPVVDQTGLKGTYDYKLTWTPPPPGVTPSPATMAKALEELGLHLEAKPVTVDVINVVSLKSPEQVLASK